ncbi:MAG: 1-acyl-sn-glycerol-3-phosphate acyltransferase [Candidatus Adiutrix sp.]|jgi:1-acyl-sn-glycerol-3-phosphate acyltransferase|nr:1-acyl-sn-glycerol-3-phosphate acyltransferase [Candidatus Adiutrix sp.]
MKNPVLKFLYLLWYLPVLVLSTVTLGTICVAVSYFSARAARFLTNLGWGHIVLDPAGVTLRATGLENLSKSEGEKGGGFIIYANHSSLTDIPTVALATKKSVSWVAKASLGRIPFFGWALARVHMLVDRGGGPEAARQMVEEATRRLEGGEILAIFPEGTRNRDSETLLPFKKGAFILAKHTGAPLVPLAIKNAGNIWPAGKYWPQPGAIRVKVGPPLEPRPGEQLGELTARAQTALQELLSDDSW